MNLLAKILSSQVRAEIFRLLFNNKKPSIHLRDLQRKSQLSIGTIQKEIAHLKKLDLIISERDGNRLYYTANSNHPLFIDICSITKKTTGIIENLKNILSGNNKIECAFIFGSYARDEEKSHSDIDVIIIGDIGLRALSPKFKEIIEQADREINPHIYSLNTWKDKIKKKDHFIKSVLSNKKIFLVGDENVLKTLYNITSQLWISI